MKSYTYSEKIFSEYLFFFKVAEILQKAWKNVEKILEANWSKFSQKSEEFWENFWPSKVCKIVIYGIVTAKKISLIRFDLPPAELQEFQITKISQSVKRAKILKVRRELSPSPDLDTDRIKCRPLKSTILADRTGYRKAICRHNCRILFRNFYETGDR